jgi:hypothetical protein
MAEPAPLDPAAARKAVEEAEERRLAEIRSHGTPVTPATFAPWKERFYAELKAARARCSQCVRGATSSPHEQMCRSPEVHVPSGLSRRMVPALLLRECAVSSVQCEGRQVSFLVQGAAGRGKRQAHRQAVLPADGWADTGGGASCSTSQQCVGHVAHAS